MANLKLVLTTDGSHSVYNADLNEHYHSVHGAVQESKHVFIEAGLKEVLKDQKQIRILEVGFGTGLNCLLTLGESRANLLTIDYYTLEPFPLDETILAGLNYTSILTSPGTADDLRLIHSMTEGLIPVTDSFRLYRTTNGLHDFNNQEQFDLVYFDAFAPDVQPELWNEEAFQRIGNLVRPGGILVTYCAKGVVRRNLKAAGFSIEKLPGPPGKREMTRGRKL